MPTCDRAEGGGYPSSTPPRAETTGTAERWVDTKDDESSRGVRPFHRPDVEAVGCFVEREIRETIEDREAYIASAEEHDGF